MGLGFPHPAKIDCLSLYYMPRLNRIHVSQKQVPIQARLEPTLIVSNIISKVDQLNIIKFEITTEESDLTFRRESFHLDPMTQNL